MKTKKIILLISVLTTLLLSITANIILAVNYSNIIKQYKTASITYLSTTTTEDTLTVNIQLKTTDHITLRVEDFAIIELTQPKAAKKLYWFDETGYIDSPSMTFNSNQYLSVHFDFNTTQIEPPTIIYRGHRLQLGIPVTVSSF